jgi:hypothetical protein
MPKGVSRKKRDFFHNARKCLFYNTLRAYILARQAGIGDEFQGFQAMDGSHHDLPPVLAATGPLLLSPQRG